MSVELTITIQIILALGLGLIGWFYADRIYDRPFERTYMSVVVGVMFTGLFVMASQIIILAHYDLLWLWPITLILPVGFGVSGGPMSLFQERKYRQQRRRGRQAERKHNHKEGF